MKNIKIKLVAVIILILLVFILCQDIAHNERIIGRYYLIAIDDNEQMHVSFQVDNNNSVGIISQTVYSVGFNKNYIIVKQHPQGNRKITDYYIVRIYHEMTYWPEKGVIGPMTKDEFNKKRHELNISNIKFTRVIKSLE